MVAHKTRRLRAQAKQPTAKSEDLVSKALIIWHNYPFLHAAKGHKRPAIT